MNLTSILRKLIITYTVSSLPSLRHDSVERFEGLGVKVIQAEARFIGPRTIEAAGQQIHAKRLVIATGSRAAVPPIPGIDQVPVYTNENIFELTQAPEHLVIIGGGPIGVEMAQAHRRLGSKVTVLEGLTIMNKDDPDAVALVRERIEHEGVTVREGVKVTQVTARGNGVVVTLDDGSEVEGTHLLVAAGRTPNVDGLNLEAAEVAYSRRGIKVDARLRTSNKRIFAIGDVAGSYQFTHIAGYHAGIVIRNALFKLPAKVKTHAVPWVTFSDPELAHVGLNENQAQEQFGAAVRTLNWSFTENDRAQAERANQGVYQSRHRPQR